MRALSSGTTARWPSHPRGTFRLRRGPARSGRSRIRGRYARRRRAPARRSSRSLAGWRTRLFPTRCGFETGATGRERGFDVDDTQLAIDPLTVCGHEPDEVDRLSRDGDVGVVSTGNAHCISVAHDPHERGLVSSPVDTLDAERGRRHIEEDVELLEHRCVL